MTHRLSIGIVLAVLSGLADRATAAKPEISVYRMRAPTDAHDVEQASGLHYGSIEGREGLWTVCDRNGGASAGQLYYYSKRTLADAKPDQPVVADEVFPIVLPIGAWSTFVAANHTVGEEILDELRLRIDGANNGDGRPRLDLEAVTIAPAPSLYRHQSVYVAAEEPHNLVLELAIEGSGREALARLAAVYRYDESEGTNGTDHNDGLEGLAFADGFFWAEEGTRFHDGPPGPRLFFMDPAIGCCKLQSGFVLIDEKPSLLMTESVRKLRTGTMQTLNALTVTPKGTLLAVDRNGGWILRIDTKSNRAEPWLNLYDLDGVNLRERLAEFPGTRKMPYISIEGIAVDGKGAIWLVDDPAMPEGFRASCLIRIEGLEI